MFIVMGYGGYGFGNYGGSSGYPGYGFPGMGSVSNTKNAGQTTGLSNENAQHGQEKKSTGFNGFFNGIANGAVNLVKGIFTSQGMVMLAGTVALTWATGGAILPLLGAIGMATGGYQMLKGAADGNTEKIGEGFFNFGLSVLGFAGPKTIKAGDTEYSMVGTGKTGEVRLLDRLKAPFGATKYKAADSDEALNMYKLSWQKIKKRFNSQNTNFKINRSKNTQTKATDQFTSSVTKQVAKPQVETAKPIMTIDAKSKAEILKEVKDIFNSDWDTAFKRFEKLCTQYNIRTATVLNPNIHPTAPICVAIIDPLDGLMALRTKNLSAIGRHKVQALCEALRLRLLNEDNMRDIQFFPKTQKIIPFEDLAACMHNKFYDPSRLG